MSIQKQGLVEKSAALEQFCVGLVDFLESEYHLDRTRTGDEYFGMPDLKSIVDKLHSHKMMLSATMVSKVELEKFEIRYEAKSHQANDLALEVDRLQGELDRVEKELDHWKMNDMKAAATNRLVQLDKDNELEILRSHITDLEEQIETLHSTLDEKENQLKESNRHHEEYIRLLREFEEKDLTNEAHLNMLRKKTTALEDDVLDLRNQLLVSESSKVSTQIPESPQVSSTAAQELEEAYSVKIEELNALLRSHKNLLSEANALNQSFTHDLMVLKQERKETELEIKDLRRALDKAKFPLDRMKHFAGVFKEIKLRMDEFVDGVVDPSFKHLELRLAGVHHSAEELKFVLEDRQSANIADDLRERMIETEQALQLAINRHEEDELQIRELTDKLVSAQNAANVVHNEEVLDQLQEKDEVILHLKKLLAAAERRVLSASSDQAQKFAQSARIIGYLESECFRLHGLCDYFKSANAKLTGELKKAISKAIRFKGFEARCSTLLEQKIAADQKCSELEMNFTKMQRDQLLEASNLQEEYRLQILKLNSDLESVYAQLTAQETELLECKAQSKNQQLQLLDSEKSLREEVLVLKVQFTESEKRRISQARELSEKESEMNDIIGKLRETSMQLTQLDEKQKLLLHEAETKRVYEDQCKADLMNELQDAKDRLSEMESRLSILSAKLNSREELLLKKEAELADHVLRNSMLIDENTNLIEEVKLYKEQVRETVDQQNNVALESRSLQERLASVEQSLETTKAALSKLHAEVQEKDCKLFDLSQENEALMSKCESAEVRQKCDREELNNADAVISELRLEIEALRTLLEETTAQLADFDLRATQQKIESDGMMTELRNLEEENAELTEKVKKQKVDLRSLSEKLSASNESLEYWGSRYLTWRDQIIAIFELVSDRFMTHVNDATLSVLKKKCSDLRNNEAQESSEMLSVFVSELSELLGTTFSHVVENTEDLHSQLQYSNQRVKSLEDSLKLTQGELSLLTDLTSRNQQLTNEVSSLTVHKASLEARLSDLTSVHRAIFSKFQQTKTDLIAKACASEYLPNQLSQSSNAIVSSENFVDELDTFEGLVTEISRSLEQKVDVAKRALSDLEQTTASMLEQSKINAKQQSEDLKNAQASLLRATEEIGSTKNQLYVLELKLQGASDEIAELRSAAIESAEAVHVSNAEVRRLEDAFNQALGEKEFHKKNALSLQNELRAVEYELEQFRKRIAGNEVQLETLANSNQRLKAEKEAFDSLIESFQTEQERLRIRNSQLEGSKAVLNTVPQLLVEFDRLISAIRPVFSDDNSDSYQVSEYEVDGATLDEKVQSCSARVNAIMSRVSKFFLHYREEKKRSKIQEDTLSKLRSEVESLNDQILTQQTQLQSKTDEIDQLVRRLRSESEVDHGEQARKLLDKELKEVKSQLQASHKLLEAQQKSASRLQIDLNSKNDEISSLRRQLHASKTSLQIESAQRESEANSNLRSVEEMESLLIQLDASRQNCEKLVASVKHLENSLANERAQRQALELKAAETNKSWLKSQAIMEQFNSVQISLEVSQKEVQELSSLKSGFEEKIKQLTADLDAAKRRNVSVESRLQSVLADRDSFLQKISETQAKLHRANMSNAREKPASLEKAAEAPRVEQSLVLHQQSDSTHRQLRLEIEQLNTEMEEKEAKLSFEKKRRTLVEKELEALKIAQSKLIDDCEKLKHYSAAFRSEGREARKEVLEIVGIITEIIVQSRVDLRMSPTVKIGQSASDFDKKADSLESIKLVEALGIRDMTSATVQLREIVASLRSEMKRLKGQEENLLLVEVELTRLRRQVDEGDLNQRALQTKHADEVKYWQQRCTDLQSISASSTILKDKVTHLEKSLADERLLKERASKEVDDLSRELQRLQNSAHAPKIQVCSDERKRVCSFLISLCQLLGPPSEWKRRGRIPSAVG